MNYSKNFEVNEKLHGAALTNCVDRRFNQDICGEGCFIEPEEDSTSRSATSNKKRKGGKRMCQETEKLASSSCSIRSFSSLKNDELFENLEFTSKSTRHFCGEDKLNKEELLKPTEQTSDCKPSSKPNSDFSGTSQIVKNANERESTDKPADGKWDCKLEAFKDPLFAHPGYSEKILEGPLLDVENVLTPTEHNCITARDFTCPIISSIPYIFKCNIQNRSRRCKNLHLCANANQNFKMFFVMTVGKNRRILEEVLEFFGSHNDSYTITKERAFIAASAAGTRPSTILFPAVTNILQKLLPESYLKSLLNQVAATYELGKQKAVEMSKVLEKMNSNVSKRTRIRVYSAINSGSELSSISKLIESDIKRLERCAVKKGNLSDCPLPKKRPKRSIENFNNAVEGSLGESTNEIRGLMEQCNEAMDDSKADDFPSNSKILPPLTCPMSMDEGNSEDSSNPIHTNERPTKSGSKMTTNSLYSIRSHQVLQKVEQIVDIIPEKRMCDPKNGIQNCPIVDTIDDFLNSAQVNSVASLDSNKKSDYSSEENPVSMVTEKSEDVISAAEKSVSIGLTAVEDTIDLTNNGKTSVPPKVLPKWGVICTLLPELGYVKVQKIAERLLIDDKSLVSDPLEFSNIGDVNKFLNSRLTDFTFPFSSKVALEWIVVTTGYLKVKNISPTNPQFWLCSSRVKRKEDYTTTLKMSRSMTRTPIINSSCSLRYSNCLNSTQLIQRDRDKNSSTPTKIRPASNKVTNGKLVRINGQLPYIKWPGKPITYVRGTSRSVVSTPQISDFMNSKPAISGPLEQKPSSSIIAGSAPLISGSVGSTPTICDYDQSTLPISDSLGYTPEKTRISGSVISTAVSDAAGSVPPSSPLIPCSVACTSPISGVAVTRNFDHVIIVPSSKIESVRTSIFTPLYRTAIRTVPSITANAFNSVSNQADMIFVSAGSASAAVAPSSVARSLTPTTTMGTTRTSISSVVETNKVVSSSSKVKETAAVMVNSTSVNVVSCCSKGRSDLIRGHVRKCSYVGQSALSSSSTPQVLLTSGAASSSSVFTCSGPATADVSSSSRGAETLIALPVKVVSTNPLNSYQIFCLAPTSASTELAQQRKVLLSGSLVVPRGSRKFSVSTPTVLRPSLLHISSSSLSGNHLNPATHSSGSNVTPNMSHDPKGSMKPPIGKVILVPANTLTVPLSNNVQGSINNIALPTRHHQTLSVKNPPSVVEVSGTPSVAPSEIKSVTSASTVVHPPLTANSADRATPASIPPTENLSKTFTTPVSSAVSSASSIPRPIGSLLASNVPIQKFSAAIGPSGSACVSRKPIYIVRRQTEQPRTARFILPATSTSRAT